MLFLTGIDVVISGPQNLYWLNAKSLIFHIVQGTNRTDETIILHACLLSRFSHVWFFSTQWTVAHKAPLSMEFSRQEYWNGLPCPPPGDLPYQGVEPRSPSLQADCLPAELPGKPSYNSLQNWKFKRLKKLMTCLFWLWFYLVHFCQNFIGKIFFEFNMEI